MIIGEYDRITKIFVLSSSITNPAWKDQADFDAGPVL
jgi:hypothetical protein